MTKKSEKKVSRKTRTDETKGADTRYFEGVGRRKTSVARVRIFVSNKPTDVIINKRKLDVYFTEVGLKHIIDEVFDEAALKKNLLVRVHVKGGGISSQAEAIRHGMARALLKFDKNLRKPFKKRGWLTRDPRMKERRKFGLKKARRAPQWSKR